MSAHAPACTCALVLPSVRCVCACMRGECAMLAQCFWCASEHSPAGEVRFALRCRRSGSSAPRSECSPPKPLAVHSVRTLPTMHKRRTNTAHTHSLAGETPAMRREGLPTFENPKRQAKKALVNRCICEHCA
jgi:hypothetical protein